MVDHETCPFCRIAFHGAPVEGFKWAGDRVMTFTPLNPVTPGHRLFVPIEHVGSAAADPEVAGRTMEAAARYVHEHIAQANIITSIGEYATQTVHHLHIHVVPRRFGDGLALPWTAHERKERA